MLVNRYFICLDNEPSPSIVRTSLFLWPAYSVVLGFLPDLRAQELLEDLLVTAPANPSPELSTLELSALATLSGGADVEDMIISEPNVSVGGGLGTRFALRGVSQEGTPSVGTRSNSSVGVVTGGIARSTNTLWGFGATTWDARSVEIVRGPVLFGRGQVFEGGSINIEPNVPVFTHEGRLLVEGGEYGHLRTGLTENVVLIPDVLALRLNAATEETDGSITNIALLDDEFAAFRRDLLRGQLQWRPAADEHAVFDLLVESEKVRGNPLGLATILPGGDFFDRRVAMNLPERVPVDRTAAALHGRVDLGSDIELEGELTWQELDGYQLGDFDAGPVLDWRFFAGQDERRLTGGARLSKRQEQQSWTLGLYGESSDYAMDFNGVGLAPFPAGSPFESRVDEEVKMAAAFFHGERDLGHDWWLHGGLRLDHQERDQASRSAIAGTVTGAGQDDVSSTEWLPELGVEWRGDTAKAGVKLTRAYRPAGVSRTITLGTSQPYGEERGWELNLLAEKEWDDWMTGLRVFYAKLDDQQISYVAAGGLPILDELIGNAGRSTRAGAEVELEWDGPRDLSASISGGYLFTEFDELAVNGVNRSGQELPNSPEFGAALEIGWNPECGWFGESLLSWTDTSYSEIGSPVATGLEKRLLLSARTGYRLDSVELYVFGNNLLDEDFALVRHDYRAIGRGIDGVPNTPRLIGAGISVEW